MAAYDRISLDGDEFFSALNLSTPPTPRLQPLEWSISETKNYFRLLREVEEGGLVSLLASLL